MKGLILCTTKREEKRIHYYYAITGRKLVSQCSTGKMHTRVRAVYLKIIILYYLGVHAVSN